MSARQRETRRSYTWPDENGHFGPYGGMFVPETLMGPLEELIEAYNEARNDPAFRAELVEELKDFVGRPSPLYYARRLSDQLGGAKILFKREDLNHTGAHKINNAIGQALLARRMNKRRIIAETGAGQHGVATATVAARYGMECVVYMGEEDIRRQSPNVFRMKLLGAKVHPVTCGSKKLKDAMNEAVRDWVTNIDATFYLIGSVAGFHPYPLMVRDFQKVIGVEARQQCLLQVGALPDVCVACVGGGSNAIGLFYDFIGESGVRLVGVEAAGAGLATGKHAAPLAKGAPGVLHGSRSYLMQDPDGQVMSTHSVAAGLDYPGVGPEHSWLKDKGMAEYVAVTDAQAMDALVRLTRTEGILPALESAHAVAHAMRIAPEMRSDQSVLVCLSGRGDKDIYSISDYLGTEGMTV
ncbi:tryptophan synthase subunit beta [Ferrovum sp.]|uniref:tryptophan synthase subunit beta n=1 Tax=Ferrovum sp. TaxID=2609467 RepID=UPI00262581FA|nr:tryptophan synthase subunit beta [Ferrovum sp.]